MSRDQEHPLTTVESRIVGFVWEYQAVCGCGWKGEPHVDAEATIWDEHNFAADFYTWDATRPPAEKAACHDAYDHRERNRRLTLDDFRWLAGTGPYAQ